MVDHNILLDQLNKLLDSQWEELIFRLGVDEAHLRANVTKSQRSIDVIRLFEQREDGLLNLQNAVNKILNEYANSKELKNSLARVMPDVTYEDMEFVIKALLEQDVSTSTTGLVDFTLTNPEEKMFKNHLTQNIRILLDMGLAKAQEVHHLIESIVKINFPNVPDRLKQTLNEEYKRLMEQGLKGDELFKALYAFTSCHNPDEVKKAAGLAVLCYFFEICDVFEP